MTPIKTFNSFNRGRIYEYKYYEFSKIRKGAKKAVKSEYQERYFLILQAFSCSYSHMERSLDQIA